MKVSNGRGVSWGRTAARPILMAGVLAAATGLAPGGLAPASAAAAPGPATAQSQRTITLINGDHVVVTRSGGVQSDAVTPAGSGVNQALLRLDLGGQVYEIPADAVPYLGRGLSPSLFEVSSLLAAEARGRLPVQLSYQGQLRRLPGVTITGSGDGTARGYLTASSAAAFGAALARQMAADHARGSYGSDGMFASGVSIGLPGQATAAPVRPDYPMHTLTVTATDLSGQPDTGDSIEVLSADGLTRFGLNLEASFSSFYHGVAKYSVPAGPYMATAFFDVMSGGKVTGFRTVVLPQFTVAGNTTIALPESSASDQVQIVTPRPAVTQDLTLGIHRSVASGNAVTELIDSRTLPQWVNQTRQPVTVGTLHTIMTARLTSPAGAGQPYEYDLAMAGPNGRIGSQRYIVAPGNVATVHSDFYQDAPSTGAWTPASAFGFQSVDGILIAFSDTYPFTLPQSEIQYTSAGSSLFWADFYWQSATTLGGGQFDQMRTFTGGQVVTIGWNAYPLHPSPAVNPLGTANPHPVVPTASRAGNTLTLDVVPFGDNTPGHTGTGFWGPGNVSGSYELDQNGTQIASGAATPGLLGLSLQTDLSSQPATDRFVLNATRTDELSASSQTIWTWRSAPEPGATLPAGWTCPAGNQACAVEPMMTLLYQVTGMGLDGSAPAGQQRIVITAGHLQLAPAAPVTALTVAASVNGGQTWQPAAVTRLGGGRFAAAFTAPPGASVSLRTQATDNAGDSIAETVTSAYQTTS
jgi:hypothetical protein